MAIDLIVAGQLIGRVVRSRAGAVFAYSLSGPALGTFADIDAAAALVALSHRKGAA